MSIAIVCMTIDEEVINGNMTTETSIYDTQHADQWSRSYMWTYDAPSWSARAQDVMAEEVCPGEEGTDEEVEEVSWKY